MMVNQSRTYYLFSINRSSMLNIFLKHFSIKSCFDCYYFFQHFSLFGYDFVICSSICVTEKLLFFRGPSRNFDLKTTIWTWFVLRLLSEINRIKPFLKSNSIVISDVMMDKKPRTHNECVRGFYMKWIGYRRSKAYWAAPNKPASFPRDAQVSVSGA